MYRPITDWGPFLFLRPEEYVDPEAIGELDMVTWSDDYYDYKRDRGWWIFGDWIQEPKETILRGKGDCEDYAIVAASWNLREGKDVWFGWMWEGVWPPYPTHVIAFTDRSVFSSGRIFWDTDVSEYIEMTKYTHYVSRKVS
jgi:hypothetical protein